MSSNYKCQSCGAPLVVEESYARVVACGYCGATMSLLGGTLEVSGAASKIKIGNSFLRVGAIGSFQSKPFRVMGAVRYHYNSGIWTEWQLNFDSGSAWLQEDEGELILFLTESECKNSPDFSTIKISQTISVDSKQMVVLEIGEAVVASISGQVPSDVRVGQGFYFADAASGGEVFSLEYFYTYRSISSGAVVERSDFKIDF